MVLFGKFRQWFCLLFFNNKRHKIRRQLCQAVLVVLKLHIIRRRLCLMSLFFYFVKIKQWLRVIFLKKGPTLTHLSNPTNFGVCFHSPLPHYIFRHYLETQSTFRARVWPKQQQNQFQTLFSKTTMDYYSFINQQT